MKKTYAPMEMKIDKISVNQAVAACTTYFTSGGTFTERGANFTYDDSTTPTADRKVTIYVHWESQVFPRLSNGTITVNYTDTDKDNQFSEKDILETNDSNFSASDFIDLMKAQNSGKQIIAS